MPFSQPPKRLPTGRILVVEGEARTRESLRELLEADGHQVSCCQHAGEALEHLKQATLPDLIVLDLMTPVMDGWQFRLEQRKEPRLSGIPVIVLSADSSPKAAAIDADAYLNKPLDYALLRDTVERLLASFERKKNHTRQMELGRLSSLGTLAAGVAHEINNPLTFVSGNLALAAERCRRALEASELSACTKELQGISKALSEAVVGADRIASVVAGLSTFARPEDSSVGPLDLSEVLEISLQLTQNEIRHRAQLVKEMGPQLPKVMGSKARLSQVFVNLLLNAAQAIPEGHADTNQITVSASVDQGRVVIAVRDTGRGIAPEVLGRIYEPFFTTKPVGVGMGLGLSICYAAVHGLGGTLDVETALGKGATFRVALPIDRSEVVATNGKGHDASLPLEPHKGRVLVIDDEELVCSLLVNMLSPHHEVTALSSAREAMKRVLAGERYDVILCDLMMPEMTGMDFYAELRVRAPEQLDRLVFLTGGAFTEASRRFLASIPNQQIGKPFSLSHVIELVRRRTLTRAFTQR